MVPAVILILRATAGMALGFFLPGYLLARVLGASHRWLWGFPLSLMVLFWAIFAAGWAGLPVDGSVVGGILFAVTLVLVGVGWWQGSGAVQVGRVELKSDERLGVEGWVTWGLLGGLIALVAVVVFRTVLWPLGGPDTLFRWDFLAGRMLDRRGFGFYPPIGGNDFRDYFYPDGFPPLVSFSYWWLYVVAGKHAELTGILVGAQLASILGITFFIGRRVHSVWAGALAAGILGGSTLFVWGTAIGEETGLTALSAAAMIWAVVEDDSETNWRAMVLVGLAGAIGALAREYGVLIPALGCIALVWRGKGWKSATISGATAFAVAGPWYLRNAIRCGNPFYSNRLGTFYVNPMHARMIDYYREQLGASTWDASQWLKVSENLVCSAPLQCTLGLVAAGWLIRKWGFLSVMSAAMGAVWLYSIGFTASVNSNYWYAERVLTPALVGLSVLGGVLAARLGVGKIGRGICGGIVLVGLGWSVAAATIYPADASWSGFGQWRENVVARRPGFDSWWAQLPEVLPAGTRILSDDAYIFVGLQNSGVEIVPVWSPEVEFIGDASLTPADVRRRLIEHGIRFVIFEVDLNGRYLSQQVPFYREDIGSWRLLGHSSDKSAWIFELPGG